MSSAAILLSVAQVRQRAQRMLPLSLIVAAHVGVFYILQSGMLRQSSAVTQTAPKEIFASLIAIDKTPKQAPQKQPTIQPQVKPVHRQETVPRPVAPTPAPRAISQEPVAKPTPPAAQTSAQPVTRQEQPAAAAAPSVPSTPAASAAPVASALPKTITSGVEYIQAPQPEYPPISKRLGDEGRVVLRVLVNEKGRAERVEVQTSSGITRLDEAARQALMRTVFKPHTEDGKTVAVFAIVPITFQLNK